MKRITAILSLLILPFLIACSSGGGGLAPALNPFGFVISSFNTAKNATLTTSDVRALVFPKVAGSMYAGTDAGLFSFDPSVVTPVFTRVDTGAIAALPSINALVADGTDGDFYICTDNGLKKFNAAASTITDVDAAFTGKKVLTVKRQSTTVLWVGLEDVAATTQSVAKIDSGVVAFYGTAQGMTASSVADIYAASDIVIACGTGSTGKTGLFKFNSTAGTFAQEAVNTGLEKGASVLAKIGEGWYAAGPDSGVIVSTNNRDTWAKTNLQNCSPRALVVEPAANALGTRYWIPTEKGLYLSYNMSDFHLFTTTKGLAADVTSHVSAAGSIVYSSHNTAAGGISRLGFDGN